MADHSPPKPLQRYWTLNADVLLYILELQITFPHTPNLNGSALLLARRSSQVCRQWRSLILDTPWLWAKLIDLNALRDTSDNWKHEVLRRTGNAPLWVSGSIVEKHRGYPFFLVLLDKYWEQIQVFTLRFTVVTPRTPDFRWNAMQRPSRHLRSFNLQIAYANGTLLAAPTAIMAPPPLQLLNAETPALQNLTASVVPPFNIHIQSPSIRTLKLTLGYSSQDSLPSFLAGLRTLINLQSLEVRDSSADRALNVTLLPTASRILLPRLTTITLQSPWSTLARILGQLHPAAGCSVFIRTHSFIRPEALNPVEDVINTYSRNFWDVHQSQYVEMAIDENCFKVHPWKGSLPAIRSNYHATVYHDGQGMIYREDTVPEFSIQLSLGINTQAAIEHIVFALTCVPRVIFEFITHLHISRFSSAVPPGPITQLIDGLTCVEYLAVSLDFFQLMITALRTLVHENRAGSTHLPALRTLKLLYGESLGATTFMPIIEYANLRRSLALDALYTLDLVDMEVKVLMPLTALLSPCAEIVLYPTDTKKVIN